MADNGRLVCYTECNSDEGKTVKITGLSTGITRAGIITNKHYVFEDVQTPEEYKVSLINKKNITLVVKEAEYVYTQSSSGTSPVEEGLYEEDSNNPGEYILSEHTTFVNGKIYYRRDLVASEETETVIEEVKEFEGNVIINYGEYASKNVGMNINTFDGIKRIVNAHLEEEYLTVGHEVDMTLLDGTHHPMIVAAINHDMNYPHQVIFVSKYLLPVVRKLNNPGHIPGAYETSTLSAELNGGVFFNILPKVVREAISPRKFLITANVSSGDYTLQICDKNIWMPREKEILIKRTGSNAFEDKITQFPLFTREGQTVKKLGESGGNNAWMTSTMQCAGSYWNYLMAISNAGLIYNNAVAPQTDCGVLPCFHIIADDTPFIALTKDNVKPPII